MKTKIVKDKQGEQYSLEIFQGKDEIKNEYQRIEREITPIVKKIGIDAGDYIHHWLGNADNVALVSQDEKTLGFATAMYYSDKILYIPTLMLDPDIQKRGVMSILARQIIKDYFIWRLKNNLLNLIRPIYIIFRTDNPTLYKILHSKLEIYPKPDGTLPKLKHEIQMVADFVKRIWPKTSFNQEKFILEKAFLDHPELMYKHETVPWSGTKEIDELFSTNLKFRELTGHAQIVLGKLQTINLLRSIIK